MTKLHLLWRRCLATPSGKIAVMCLVPFLARPSEFSLHAKHRLCGKVAALAFPAAPAWLGSKALALMATTSFKHYDWKMPPGDAIAASQSFTSWVSWESWVFLYSIIVLIAGLRWTWHFCLRKWTDRTRTDGQTAGAAPFSFFAADTSGRAAWASVWFMIIAIVDSFYYGRRFAVIEGFFDTHSGLRLVVGALLLIALYALYRSNTAILLDVYKTPDIIRRVRTVTWGTLAALMVVDFVILTHIASASLP